MRLVVVIALLGLGGCSSDGKSPSTDAGILDGGNAPCEFMGRTYAGDALWRNECNSCMCMNGVAACTLIGCGSANGDESDSCAPAGASAGPACGTTFCSAGEHCNGWFCVCGEAELICDPAAQCGTTPGTCGASCVAAP